MTARVAFDGPGFRLYLGRADEWAGGEQIDLVLTNPYGPLPTPLHATPQLIHQWCHRKAEAERWCGNDLALVGTWNDGREAFWAANLRAIPVDLSDLRPEPGGWYPPELVRRLLTVYGKPGYTVWDGFMGRGTVGRVALEMGMRYVGVEELEAHLALAINYLAPMVTP